MTQHEGKTGTSLQAVPRWVHPIDYLRSAVRHAGERLLDPLDLRQKVETLKPKLEQLLKQEFPLVDKELSSIVASFVASATTAVSPDGMSIEAQAKDGTHASLLIRRVVTRFAPGGAKELTFEVERPALERTIEERTLENRMLFAVAEAIAQKTWSRSALLSNYIGKKEHTQHKQPAIVDWETDTKARVDLRAVPTYRNLQSHPLASTFVQVFEARSVRFISGEALIAIGIAGTVSRESA